MAVINLLLFVIKWQLSGVESNCELCSRWRIFHILLYCSFTFVLNILHFTFLLFTLCLSLDIYVCVIEFLFFFIIEGVSECVKRIMYKSLCAWCKGMNVCMFYFLFHLCGRLNMWVVLVDMTYILYTTASHYHQQQ